MHGSTGEVHSKAVLVRQWCGWGKLHYRNQEMVGHVKYPGSRFWLLLKRQEVLDYRKAGQERKKVWKKYLRTQTLIWQWKGEPLKSDDRLTRGIRYWEGVWFGQWNSSIRRVYKRHATPFTFGLKHRWTYFLRTLPDIQDLLEPLENAIFLVLIHTFASQCPNMLKWLNFGVQNERIFKPHEASYVMLFKCFCDT